MQSPFNQLILQAPKTRTPPKTRILFLKALLDYQLLTSAQTSIGDYQSAHFPYSNKLRVEPLVGSQPSAGMQHVGLCDSSSPTPTAYGHGPRACYIPSNRFVLLRLLLFLLLFLAVQHPLGRSPYPDVGNAVKQQLLSTTSVTLAVHLEIQS